MDNSMVVRIIAGIIGVILLVVIVKRRRSREE